MLFACTSAKTSPSVADAADRAPSEEEEDDDDEAEMGGTESVIGDGIGRSLELLLRALTSPTLAGELSTALWTSSGDFVSEIST